MGSDPFPGFPYQLHSPAGFYQYRARSTWVTNPPDPKSDYRQGRRMGASCTVIKVLLGAKSHKFRIFEEQCTRPTRYKEN